MYWHQIYNTGTAHLSSKNLFQLAVIGRGNSPLHDQVVVVHDQVYTEKRARNTCQYIPHTFAYDSFPTGNSFLLNDAKYLNYYLPERKSNLK